MSFVADFTEKLRISRIKDPKKRKQESRLYRSLKDNKIDKKEAKKLQKVGLNSFDIDRYSSNRDDRKTSSQARDRSPKPTSYKPPVYSKGAGGVFTKGLSAPKPKAKAPTSMAVAPAYDDSLIEQLEAYSELPDPDEYLAQFDPVTPTNYSVVQQPLTIGNPLKKKQQGGLSQFNSGLKIKSKLLNI